MVFYFLGKICFVLQCKSQSFYIKKCGNKILKMILDLDMYMNTLNKLNYHKGDLALVWRIYVTEGNYPYVGRKKDNTFAFFLVLVLLSCKQRSCLLLEKWYSALFTMRKNLNKIKVHYIYIWILGPGKHIMRWKDASPSLLSARVLERLGLGEEPAAGCPISKQCFGCQNCRDRHCTCTPEIWEH